MRVDGVVNGRETVSVSVETLARGEPTCLHIVEAACRLCRSSESAIAVEAFMNNVG